MIDKGDGTFAELYGQGRCPRCRCQMWIADGVAFCHVCKIEHRGVGDGNIDRLENGTVDHRCDCEGVEG